MLAAWSDGTQRAWREVHERAAARGLGVTLSWDAHVTTATVRDGARIVARADAQTRRAALVGLLDALDRLDRA